VKQELTAKKKKKKKKKRGETRTERERATIIFKGGDT
jgi:hypothetical protein